MEREGDLSMRLRAVLVALAATVICTPTRADDPSPAPPYRRIARTDADPVHLRTVMPWLARGFLGADRPFDALYAPVPGTTWPLYATDDIAIDLADRLRTGHPEIVVEVCELERSPSGAWASIATSPWLVRHPAHGRTRVHEPCIWRGDPTGYAA